MTCKTKPQDPIDKDSDKCKKCNSHQISESSIPQDHLQQLEKGQYPDTRIAEIWLKQGYFV